MAASFLFGAHRLVFVDHQVAKVTKFPLDLLMLLIVDVIVALVHHDDHHVQRRLCYFFDLVFLEDRGLEIFLSDFTPGSRKRFWP